MIPSSSGLRTEALVVMQDRRDDARRAVRRRGHDPSTCGILLVHRERIEVHPVQNAQRIPECAFGIIDEFFVQSAGHGVLPAVRREDSPSRFVPRATHPCITSQIRSRAVADLRFRTPGLLVLEDKCRNAQHLIVALPQERGAAVERKPRAGPVRRSTGQTPSGGLVREESSPR